MRRPEDASLGPGHHGRRVGGREHADADHPRPDLRAGGPGRVRHPGRPAHLIGPSRSDSARPAPVRSGGQSATAWVGCQRGEPALRRRRHRRRPGRLRRGALRRVGRARTSRSSRSTRSAAPVCNRGCIPAKELLETAAIVRTVKHAGDFGVDRRAQGGRLGHHARRASRRSSTSWRTASSSCSRTARSRCSTASARSAPDRTVVVIGTAETASPAGHAHRRRRDPGERLGAPDDPRASSPTARRGDLRRVLRHPAGPAACGGHRWRCDRVRVRVDARRPRAAGHHPRGAAEDPPGLRRRRDPGGPAGPSRRRDIEIRTGVAVTGHTPDRDGGTTVNVRRRRDARDRPRGRLGRSRARTPTTCSRTAPG